VIFDFSTIMVLLVAASGAIWGIDAWLFRPRRIERAAGTEVGDPMLVDYARSFFPIFLIVLILRAFLVEPFRIRYPEDPSTPFIKRVVGLPGDQITYKEKRLRINGVQVPYDDAGTYVGVKSAVMHTGAQKLVEHLDGQAHDLLVTPRAYSFDWEGTVPPDSYFVLGDNRDNSRDSRFWGFVPNENLIGRAFMIWMNWDNGPDLKRIGTRIK